VTNLESDLWPLLRSYWHPVCPATEVLDKPLPVTLLDEKLVVARLRGRAVCFRDLCIHRGTPLSLGWVEDGELVCAYHGWRYRADGACTRIPALPADRAIPSRARVQAYRAEERYGLIWVCLDEAKSDIPEFPEFDDPAYKVTAYPPVRWRCSAARQTENFVDQAHFAWLHEGILGDREHPETATFDIERFGEELRYRYTDQPNPMHPVAHERVYRLHRPFTIHQRKIRTGEDDVEVSYNTSCPVSAGTSVGYLLVARNFALDPVEEMRRFQLDRLIQAQDQPIVEAQRPDELPLDLSEELHIKGPDSVAVAYRRFIAELGVDADVAPAVEVEQ
jgi:phenylpropionate dioxygenase-like ring-hydroxylating dioxygenase large terminal subunit